MREIERYRYGASVNLPAERPVVDICVRLSVHDTDGPQLRFEMLNTRTGRTTHIQQSIPEMGLAQGQGLDEVLRMFSLSVRRWILDESCDQHDEDSPH